ncbi:hypothetical protein RJ639_036793 [Escallonia herrerae]|uniref:Mitochondrial import inner membrane translocase subunit TIM50 n=1 Tax=Escallonia herrerae TaxID=1293975 RepID=A0AA88WTQ0_9ASTE|nr:hypothetical protein RJ639_036793 [Escallonia herrerae]
MVKPIFLEGLRADSMFIHDPRLKQVTEKNERVQEELEQAANRSFLCGGSSTLEGKSRKEHPFPDADVIKHVSLAVVGKLIDGLKVSHPPVERTLVTFSRRKLIILDINGLLADIVTPPPKECKADINISRRAILFPVAVFKRPFFSDFLKFCFERFDVGIWSSRSKKIVDRVVDYLLGDMKDKLLFCWDLSHCTETGFKTLENRHKTLVFKELKKIWERSDPNLPWEKGTYNESNTLLLDDSPYKALLNPMHTAIFPHSFNFKDRGDKSLGPEGDLRVYMEELATAENIQKYVKENPFGQGCIDETSSFWAFYSRLLCSQSILSNNI